ncbi:hypothetical protein GW750_04960 [bacterium]|nr:hypothetical protein [bacterium]
MLENIQVFVSISLQTNFDEDDEQDEVTDLVDQEGQDEEVVVQEVVLDQEVVVDQELVVEVEPVELGEIVLEVNQDLRDTNQNRNQKTDMINHDQKLGKVLDMLLETKRENENDQIDLQLKHEKDQLNHEKDQVDHEQDHDEHEQDHDEYREILDQKILIVDIQNQIRDHQIPDHLIDLQIVGQNQNDEDRPDEDQLDEDQLDDEQDLLVDLAVLDQNLQEDEDQNDNIFKRRPKSSFFIVYVYMQHRPNVYDYLKIFAIVVMIIDHI